jgi:hypothetical protein
MHLKGKISLAPKQQRDLSCPTANKTVELRARNTIAFERR